LVNFRNLLDDEVPETTCACERIHSGGGGGVAFDSH
jgi:hypothetical protein